MLKTVRSILSILLLVLSFHASAASARVCPPAAEQPASEAIQDALRNASDHGFMWRISKDGRTSFLYGTIHVAKFEWMFPGPSVMQALNAADTVALELDVTDADIQSRVASGMATLPNTALPAALVKRMRQQADSMCVPYDSIARFSRIADHDVDGDGGARRGEKSAVKRGRLRAATPGAGSASL